MEWIGFCFKSVSVCFCLPRFYQPQPLKGPGGRPIHRRFGTKPTPIPISVALAGNAGLFAASEQKYQQGRQDRRYAKLPNYALLYKLCFRSWLQREVKQQQHSA
jgi:hypothetical protein